MPEKNPPTSEGAQSPTRVLELASIRPLLRLASQLVTPGQSCGPVLGSDCVVGGEVRLDIAV